MKIVSSPRRKVLRHGILLNLPHINWKERVIIKDILDDSPSPNFIKEKAVISVPMHENSFYSHSNEIGGLEESLDFEQFFSTSTKDFPPNQSLHLKVVEIFSLGGVDIELDSLQNHQIPFLHKENFIS